MARIHELLRQLRATGESNAAIADDIEREMDALSDRRAFGLNFERHTPEAVELPGRPIRTGDKVRVLPPRGSVTGKSDHRLWRVVVIEGSGDSRTATIESHPRTETTETSTVAVDDLVVVAEFRDPIYPGLVSTGRVERGGDKPFHTVINGENFHALQTLLFTHRGKVDAIYIDPPYNTGAKDWKYNNDYVEGDDLYRHSKWLAFMERRLFLAKELLSSCGVLIVTIDEHEVHRLAQLLEQVFPDHYQQTVTIVNNPRGVTQGYLSRVEEYAIFCFGEDSVLYPVEDDLLTHRDVGKNADVVQRPRWKGLLRSGDEALRADRPNMFYPVWLDPRTRRLIRAGEPLALLEEPDLSLTDGELVATWPVRRDGQLGRWGIGHNTLNELIADGFASCGSRDRVRGTWAVSYLSAQLRRELADGRLSVLGRDPRTGVADVAYVDGPSRRMRTVWHRSSHDAGAHGTDLVGSLLGAGRTFPFPKSLYAVEDSIRVLVKGREDATVVDFFSGSGTTAHAVMRLNRQDGGRRTSISVTNNEVSAEEQKRLRAAGLRPGDPEWERWGICEHITKPRIRAAITGMTPEGEPIKGDYKFADIFPLADGFEENMEFLTLTYEAPLRLRANRDFAKVAPLLWLRAGSRGARIDSVPDGWAVADAYGVIADLDKTDDFLTALAATPSVTHAFIITDDDSLFEAVVADLPRGVEPVRLYDAYLRNFEIDAMRGVR